MGKAYFAEAAGGEVGARRRGIPGWGSSVGKTFTSASLAKGGVTLDTGVYVLDTALHLLGYPKPLSVTAFTAGYLGRDGALAKGSWDWDPSKFEVEDFSSAFIRFEGGISVVYKQAWAMHAETLGNPLVLGTKGGLSLSPLRLYTDMNGYMVNITPTYPQAVDEFEMKIKEFIKACKGEAPDPIDPYDM
ncbi:MAG: Gfo/Idh/MocA family protein, partial [Thermoprotei archaeon]